MAQKHSPLPPGPRSPVWQLLQYSYRPFQFLEGCARRYGDPFTMRMAGYGRFVMFSSPDAIKEIFRGDPHTLHSGEGNDFLSVTLGKNSVLVLDEEPHARQRQALLPPLKGERMRSFFTAMQQSTIETARSWPLNEPLRMLEPMQSITLEVMLRVVLGVDSPSEIASYAHKVERLLALSRSRHMLVQGKMLPIALLQRIPWIPYFERKRALDEAIFAAIAKQRRDPAAQRGESVLADLVAATHADGQSLSDEELRDDLATLIFAGHDTTAIALAWAFEQIVPRADVMESIAEELRRVTGGAPPRADQLDQLTYLDAAIHESLRLRTVIPFIVRLTKAPFTVCGREYPRDVLLSPCIHLVHRREELYPEPEVFRPERFLERRFSASEWIPFGGGGRMCLGMSFALYEMKVVLATIFALLRLERPTGARSNPVRRGVAIAPDDGALIRVAEKFS